MRTIAEIVTGLAIAVFFFRLGFHLARHSAYFYMKQILEGEGLDVLEMVNKYKQVKPQ